MPNRYFFFFLLLAGCASQQKLSTNDDATATNLRHHIEYLASDELEGRRTGTQGEAKAAAYIANAFEKTGLQPKGTNGFFQAFPVAEGREVTNATSLTINGNTLELNKDFFPMAYCVNSSIDAMPSVALMEKGEPWFFDVKEVLNQNKNNPHFDVDKAVFNQANDVLKKGASALFVYNSSSLPDGLGFEGRYEGDRLSIPVIYISKDAAKKYLKDPSALLKIKANVEIKDKNRSGKNVIGYLDNGAPYTIVIGAHYDHLGFGEDDNSLYRGGEKQIHNGADDNASGTAALIELARLLKTTPLKTDNYLFIAFSGEELGLFGSKYFVQHPTVNVGSINFMINMDMVGRLNDSTKTIAIGGYGTSPVWGQLFNRQGKQKLYSTFNYRFDSSGMGPSDHTSFYLKNIPVLFYFTGIHSDYHKPSDDFDKINYKGEADVVKHIYSLLQATNELNTKLSFTKTRDAQISTTSFSVTLGIMPDYSFNGAGVRVDAVIDGRPAQKAKLQAGDVITALGENKVASMEAYMQALSKFKKSDKTTVSYTRNGQAFTTTVEF